MSSTVSVRYKSLDLWRGVACLSVLFFHSGFYAPSEASAMGQPLLQALLGVLRWGWLGVPLFFVISGYCIAASVDSFRERGDRLSEYFLRRLRRIYPPYWIFLAITVALVLLVENSWSPGFFEDSSHPIANPRTATAWQWIGGLTLTESWRHHIVGGPQRHIVAHAWTLCYEEQFYALAGCLMLITRRHITWAFGAVSAAVLVIRHASWRFGFAENIGGFFFDGSWLMFAAGVSVYFEAKAATRTARIISRTILLLGVLYSVRDIHDIEYGYLCASLFALFLSLGHEWDGRVVATRCCKPLFMCGTMCYSIYLVHWPVAKATSRALSLVGIDSSFETLALVMPACLLATILVAMLFHIHVERRFLNSPRTVSCLDSRDVEGVPSLRQEALGTQP